MAITSPINQNYYVSYPMLQQTYPATSTPNYYTTITSDTLYSCPYYYYNYYGEGHYCSSINQFVARGNEDIVAMRNELQGLRDQITQLQITMHEMMAYRSHNVHEEVCGRDDQGSERQALDTGRGGEGTTDVTHWPPRQPRREASE